MNPFELSASDAYVAAGFLGLTITVSAWFAVALLALGVVLAGLEFVR